MSAVDVATSTFEKEVLDRSRDVPVVVDFWAPWCGPCRTLGPVLEELAEAADGRWVLAKVNSDESPELAQAYGVRGIPAVKAFVDGQLVDEFTGALPKTEVERFLQRIVPTRADRLLREALAASEAGDRTRERALWDELLAEDPRNGLALVQRARLLLGEGRSEDARRDLDAVPEESGLRDQAESLLHLAEWTDRAAADGGVDAARERAAAAPEDPAARYAFGCALAVAGDFAGALAEFLEVVRLDRSFEEDAGRRAMLAIFTFLGDAHDLTREFRGKLSGVLF
jgi:putative thioredoxin